MNKDTMNVKRKLRKEKQRNGVPTGTTLELSEAKREITRLAEKK